MTDEPLFPDDLELVAAVRRGDLEARDTFLQRSLHIPRILGLKNRRLGVPFSSSDLADLAQETFVQVWSRLETYRGAGNLEAWFYRFCCNVLGNALQRRSSVGRRQGREEALPREPEAAEQEQDFLETEQLLAALDELEPVAEEVVRLKLLAGMTFEELSARLGISANTAKTRYYRGLEQIRFRLERREGAR